MSLVGKAGGFVGAARKKYDMPCAAKELGVKSLDARDGHSVHERDAEHGGLGLEMPPAFESSTSAARI